MKAGVEYCETVLWELIESGASASDSLGATSYSDFLADSAKRGAKEKGRGALVLSAPVHALKSWFELIERKLNSGQKLLTEELVNISKAEYFSCAEMQNLFGKHIQGGCDQELATYNPVTEFLFVRLYLSTGQSGDGTLMWDAVAYEGESDAELVKKFQLLSVEEVGKLLLQSVKLQEYDQVSLRNGSVQDAKQMILRQKCGECGKEREGNSACGGCGVVMYCGRDCQVKQWPSHKLVCKKLKEAKEQFLK